MPFQIHGIEKDSFLEMHESQTGHLSHSILTKSPTMSAAKQDAFSNVLLVFFCGD